MVKIASKARNENWKPTSKRLSGLIRSMMRAAKANAALDGRTEVTKMDLRTVAPLVLGHRLKKRAFEEVAFDMKELDLCLGL